MGGACGTYERQERCIQGFGGETKGKRPLGRPRLDGRIILKWTFKKWDGEAWTGLVWLRTGGGYL
jgi:hypothetical protein